MAAWLVTDNVHRSVIIEAAQAGEGVVRIFDLPDYRAALQAGRLVRALADWQPMDVPPVNLMYRPSCRRIPRVRAFIDFMAAFFRHREEERDSLLVASERPLWLRRSYLHASDVVTRPGIRRK